MTQKENNGDPPTGPGVAATTGNTAFPDAFTAVTIAGAAAITHDGGGFYRAVSVSGADAWRFYHEIAGADAWSVRFYFTLDDLPSQAQEIFKWINTSFGGTGGYGLDATNNFNVRSATGAVLETFGTALSADTEYRLEAGIVKGTGTGDGRLRAQLFLGESTTPLYSYDHSDINAGTVATLRGQWGDNTAARVSNFTFRNLLLDNAASSNPLGPYGADLDLTYVGAGAWDAPASSATVTPAYPASLAEGDVVYAELVIKPDTATVATPTDWTLVTSTPMGGGAQGAGTGPVRVHLYKRVVPSGGLSGSQAFTITGGSSPVGCMRAFRPQADATNVTFQAEANTFYSRTTGSTTFGGTGAINLSVAVKDFLVYISASADDQSSTHTISALAATGATLAAVTQSPTGTIVNAQGNDISAAAGYSLVTAGLSTAAPSSTVTGSTAETGGGFFYRVSAVGDLAPPVPRQPGQIGIFNQAAVQRSRRW